MNNTLRRIGIILIAVIVVPALLFITFELSSLNSNERVIEKIYESQLDAILFSVNQYSQDLMESWAGKIENIVAEKNKAEKINEFLSNNNSIDAFYIINTKNLKYINSFQQSNFKRKLSFLNTLLIARKNIIEKLFTYKKSGYRKIEPVYADSNTAVLFFALQSDDLSDRMCAIAIDPGKFIQTRLEPLSLPIKNIFLTKFSLLPVIKCRLRRQYGFFPDMNWEFR